MSCLHKNLIFNYPRHPTKHVDRLFSFVLKIVNINFDQILQTVDAILLIQSLVKIFMPEMEKRCI